MMQPRTKTHHLGDPIAACGDRVYIICSQNGLFPDSWDGHVPREMWGVWDHPIKLLDGFWFGLSEALGDAPQWLIEAGECRAYAGYNEFDYSHGPLTVTRRDFVPDGIEGAVITLTIQSSEPHDVRFTLHALFRSDLRPAWLGDEAGLRDGKDSVITRDGVCVFSDADNPWACAVGADIEPAQIASGDELWAAQHTSGNGTSAHLKYAVNLGGDSTASITFFIAGSITSGPEALATVDRLKAEHALYFDEKTARCQSIIETSHITTPDETLNEAMAWSKLINQMFARHVPPYGACVGAGLPEYPWWFGIDTEYAVLPMLQSGQFDLVRDSLRFLKHWSLTHNSGEPGRVMHEMSTTGICFNAGNMVETLAFTRAAHQCWLWTGDRTFLEEMYPFCKQGVFDYALGRHDPDRDLCTSGRSVIETLEMHAGFEVIDVAAYTWEALTRLTDMAHTLGDIDIEGKAHQMAFRLAAYIQTDWWLEDESLFADMRASIADVKAVLTRLEETAHAQNWALDAQRQVQAAQRLFEPFLAKYRDLPPDTEMPWLLRHWVVLCPVEVGLASSEQAGRLLARLQSDEFCNEWGMYLHPDRHDVMSINTGLLALAAARYGRVDDALALIGKLTSSFSRRTLGAVGEALPDKWCFLQLWSNVGLVAPVVECFLGIEPRADERRLRVVPNLPAAWPHASARRLRAGEASIDMDVERAGDAYTVRIRGVRDWSVEVGAILPPNTSPRAVRLNGQPCDWRLEQTTAGACLVCDTLGDVELVVEFQQALT